MLFDLAAVAVSEVPTWTDKLEAKSTAAGVVVAVATAIATFWLLVHQIRETKKARKDASEERSAAAADRELARQDRELAWKDRRDREAAQARTVVIGDYSVGRRSGESGIRVEVAVWNFSPEPILSVTVIVDSLLGDFYKVWSGSLIPPKGEERISLQLRPTKAVQSLSEYFPAVHFTDSSGQRWSRSVGGTPGPGTPHNTVYNFPDVRSLEAKQIISGG